MRKKVLLLFPMADGQTGPAIQHAFENLGYVVKAVDAKRQPLDSYSVACEYRPELVFCSRTTELTAQVAQIKREFSLAIICMWNVDMREDIDSWRHLYPLIQLCDYHFVPNTGQLSQWRELKRNSFWLPQGLQNEVYDKPREITDADRKRYTCDVAWAGSRTGFHRTDREPFLDAVVALGVNFKQWGCGGAPKVYNEEHNKMVALSKINIACTSAELSAKAMEKGTSVRIYKILGAGGFGMELYRQGIHEIFPKNTIDCFTSPEELANKVRYWLSHDKEREEIAERGYRWVHTNATYTHRIKTALEYMEI